MFEHECQHAYVMTYIQPYVKHSEMMNMKFTSFELSDKT